jgi:DNA polymerase elongation subunit (family B)
MSEIKEYSLKDLQALIDTKDIPAIKKYMQEYNLELDGNKIVPKDKEYYKEKEAYWDLEQYIKKIVLNSSYGALLNSNSTFYMYEIGASTTMSGRKIVQHMASKTNEIAIGEYKHKGGIVAYGDTDSVYTRLSSPEFKEKYPNFNYNRENVSKFYHTIAKAVDASYAEHVKNIFHVPDDNSKIIKADLEIVGEKALFVSKKRYAICLFEKDGLPIKDKLKIMGLQIKKSDTPKIVRDVMKRMMEALLIEKNNDKVIQLLKDFKHNEWTNLEPWLKGSPKTANNIDKFTEDLSRDIKARVPGHVMASINWNKMIDMNSDIKSPKIINGSKVVVCKLADNPWGMTSIAYPKDIIVFPKWFKELPFSEQAMTGSVVDKTLESVFGVLNMGLTLTDLENNDVDYEDFLIFV